MNAESECCGASPWMGDADYGICGECKEHCEFSYPEEYFEIYDEETNKTLHIKAEDLKVAEGIADTLDWQTEQDGAFINTEEE